MTIRPRRSLLYMPGSNARALDKARSLPADGLILDLEDAVAPDAKALAREQLARAEARYAAGADDNLAVVGAQSDLADAEQARVDALAAYNLAVVRWFAAQGRVSDLGGE